MSTKKISRKMMKTVIAAFVAFCAVCGSGCAAAEKQKELRAAKEQQLLDETLEPYAEITQQRQQELQDTVDAILLIAEMKDPCLIYENRVKDEAEGKITSGTMDIYQDKAEQIADTFLIKMALIPDNAEDMADCLYVKNAVAYQLIGTDAQKNGFYFAQDELGEIKVWITAREDDKITYHLTDDRSVTIQGIESETPGYLTEEEQNMPDTGRYMSSGKSLTLSCMADMMHACQYWFYNKLEKNGIVMESISQEKRLKEQKRTEEFYWELISNLDTVFDGTTADYIERNLYGFVMGTAAYMDTYQEEPEYVIDGDNNIWKCR